MLGTNRIISIFGNHTSMKHKAKDIYIYHLTHEGFASEINVMLEFIVWAKMNCIKWEIDDSCWIWGKGKLNYFFNYKLKPSLLNRVMRKIYRTKSIHVYRYKDKYFDFHRDDHMWHPSYINQLCTETADVWNLTKAIRRKLEKEIFPFAVEEYVGVHIRRGDKIKSGEMNDIDLEEYTTEILKTKASKCFISTDDYSSVVYIKNKLPNISVFTFCPTTLNGSFHDAFGKQIHYNHQNTYSIIRDIEFLKQSNHFIGTTSSNISRIVVQLRKFNSYSSLDSFGSL
jgi:hypothetical protein